MNIFAILSDKLFANWIGQIQSKDLKLMFQQVHKLQDLKLVSVEFAASNGKKNHICKWISFFISTFAIIEEMASVLLYDLFFSSTSSCNSGFFTIEIFDLI